jgi:hypothetical protein
MDECLRETAFGNREKDSFVRKDVDEITIGQL